MLRHVRLLYLEFFKLLPGQAYPYTQVGERHLLVLHRS